MRMTDEELVAKALERDPEAVRTVDGVIRSAAAAAARRLGGDHATADEIAQRVSERMWLGREGGEPVLRSFTGEAPLSAWLRIIAYREGVDLLRVREVSGDDALVDRVIGSTEPELSMLRSAYLAAFKRCFSTALAALSMHDRDLLRRHHLDGLTLEGLATLYGSHRATVARWLARVRDRLVVSTREALRGELSSNIDLDEVLALIASRLEASLSREL
jgi:RNA polymerase sigma-70 factor (ECF subfamily)